ncbi:MAG: alpha/beta hydrolase [Chitinophagaceae bacterium]|nr:alpha/beta hydrolase [Chitinophagaceae bacterium]
MKKRILISIVALSAFSCNITIKKATLSTTSIYSNFETGENEWYLTNPEDSVQLYIFEYGRGNDTIIVLHGGFGAEHRYLKDAFEGLYDQYHFIFYDQRGSLRSPCPIEKISIRKHVSDIEAIRKELKMEKINLFGHSNGTTLATYYLREHPDKVKGFIMTACMQMESPIKESDTTLKKLEQQAYEGFGDYIERPEVKQEIEKVENNKNLPASKKKYQIERINMAKHYIYDISLWRKGKESYGAFFNNKAGNAVIKDLQGAYENISLYKNHPFPITIIMGEKDMIDPGGGKFSYWTKDLPNVHYAIIKKAAHDAWVDQPELFRKEFVNGMNRYKK